MSLLQIEHYVELTDTLKVLVQSLHESVNELKHAELVLLLAVSAHNEEKAGVTPVRDFVAPEFQEGALQLRAGQTATNALGLKGNSV